MSWNSYIDSVLAGSTGNADQACIIGLENGGPWTTAEHANHLNLVGNEGVAIANALKSNDPSTLQQNGIHVGGVKYQFLRHDEEEGLLLGKKKENGAITIQKSERAIVVAHTIEGKPQGETNKGVKSIVDYLKGMNH